MTLAHKHVLIDDSYLGNYHLGLLNAFSVIVTVSMDIEIACIFTSHVAGLEIGDALTADVTGEIDPFNEIVPLQP